MCIYVLRVGAEHSVLNYSSLLPSGSLEGSRDWEIVALVLFASISASWDTEPLHEAITRKGTLQINYHLEHMISSCVESDLSLTHKEEKLMFILCLS